MAAGDPFLDLSDLIFNATGGTGGAPEQVNFFKKALRAGAAPGTLVAGRITSLWEYDGQPSGASTTSPTTAVVTTNVTTGSFFQATSATNTRKRLLAVTGVSLVAGSLIFYDRLNQQGGLSGTTTTVQTTNLPTAALTRRTDGVGVEAWVEIYTQIGTTGTTATIEYTDHNGFPSNTSPAFTIGGTGFREAQRILPVPLAAGDRGVRAVANIDLVASTTTAGALGITLAYPLVVLPLPFAGAAAMWTGILVAGGPLDLGVESDACIAMAWHPNTTTAPEIFGQMFLTEK